jgi:ribonuclease HI
MAKKNFYAVRKGHKAGIYESWERCKAQVDGYKSAEYKGFALLSDAEEYMAENEPVKNEPNASVEVREGEVSAYVDGSYNIKTRVYGFGIVLLLPTGEVEEIFGSGEKDNAVSMRNVAGELKGAIVAMQYAVNNQYKKLTIYYDYEGIAKWAKREWRANLEVTKAYRDFCQKIKKVIEVKFVKVLAHSGVEYNELADKLAKQGAGLCPID